MINYNPLLMMLWNFDHNIMVIGDFGRWGDNENRLIEKAKAQRLGGEKLAIMNLQTSKEAKKNIISDNVIEDWAQKQGIDYVVSYVVGDYEQRFGLENVFRGFSKNLNVDQVVMNENFLINDQPVPSVLLSKIFGAKAVYLLPQTEEGTLISEVTLALGSGDMEKYHQLTGCYFTSKGAVEKGKQLGHKINYPTANYSVDPDFPLKQGVYATRSWLPNFPTPFPGMTCYWVNETGIPVVETFLFDFDQDIYGWYIKTEFNYYLREVKPVQNLEELKALLQNDETLIRNRIDEEQKDEQAK